MSARLREQARINAQPLSGIFTVTDIQKVNRMEIVTNPASFLAPGRTALTIGKFDGIHRGHRRLLQEIMQKKDLIPCVLTFDPLPEVFFGTNTGGVLTTREEKRRLFEEMGVELLVELPFDRETASMEPERFVREILCERLRAGFVAAGPDLSFGDRGLGNYALLREMAASCGFAAQEIDKVEYGGEPISSSLIRSFIQKGEMEKARECLGAPYRIWGPVLHGNAIGRTIGIPTANQVPAPDKLLPPNGVYYSRVLLDGKEYPAMTNVGRRPTVSGQKSITVETHLYDFEGDLYGREMVTSLLTFRRPEKKFSGLSELKETMEADVKAGREYHGI